MLLLPRQLWPGVVAPDSPIYASNRTVWHLNWVQINNLSYIELFEIELFIELFVIHSNTWNNLTLLTYATLNC